MRELYDQKHILVQNSINQRPKNKILYPKKKKSPFELNCYIITPHN